jgi:hypothetical protein
MAPAEKCSCIFGIPAGQEPKCLGGHGWPKEAAIHGGKKNGSSWLP